jgi:catechol 2,3-dioxygenase-like lactoylglutathione lyase family enzyme
MTLTIDRIDHLVMTVRDIEATVKFYCDVLGMTQVSFGNNRTALVFGKQKINLHPLSNDIEPTASRPTPGALDICLITPTSISAVVEELLQHSINVELGPVQREGAQGKMTSVYLRDPDGNLVEIAHYNQI